MRTILLATAVSILPTALAAQRALADVQRAFAAAANELAKKQPTEEQRRGLLQQQVAELGAFVQKEAAGDDRWNGRLMLADLSLGLGDRAGAMTALRGIDLDAAPALLLVSGAPLVQYLGERELRDRWLEKALAKPAPVPDRLAIARILMTNLHEIARAEAIYKETLAAAADDEQRAQVRFQRADALRDREDLPENAGFDELEKLATDLPDTYWGGIAKDRLRATRLQIGDRAIRIHTRTRTGEEVSLAKLAGKIIVLAFWSATDYDTPVLVQTLADLQKKHGDALFVLGVALDRDPATIDRAIADLGITFAVAGDGKGADSDLALRWFVAGPTITVIDREGKVAAQGLHVGTADARSDLAQVIQDARR
ncbi:MAG: TlpA disulfide reductase family protein [Planctomycetota bacterium]